jgi:hypothetical protein
MSFPVDKSTRVIGQGFTGSHAAACAALVLTLVATPTLAEDIDPASLLRQGIEACVLGEGALGPTSSMLAMNGWVPDFEGEEGVFGFLPGGGPEDTYLYMSATGEFCHVESLVIGSDAARAELEAFLGESEAGIMVTGTGTGQIDCPALILSNGVTAEVSSAGNDPVCQSPDNSGLRFTYSAGG